MLAVFAVGVTAWNRVSNDKEEWNKCKVVIGPQQLHDSALIPIGWEAYGLTLYWVTGVQWHSQNVACAGLLPALFMEAFFSGETRVSCQFLASL